MILGNFYIFILYFLGKIKASVIGHFYIFILLFSFYIFILYFLKVGFLKDFLKISVCGIFNFGLVRNEYSSKIKFWKMSESEIFRNFIFGEYSFLTPIRHETDTMHLTQNILKKQDDLPFQCFGDLEAVKFLN